MYCCSISVIALRRIEAHQVRVNQSRNMDNINQSSHPLIGKLSSHKQSFYPFLPSRIFSFVDPEENARLYQV
jgi:hypothetical protein